MVGIAAVSDCRFIWRSALEAAVCQTATAHDVTVSETWSTFTGKWSPDAQWFIFIVCRCWHSASFNLCRYTRYNRLQMKFQLLCLLLSSSCCKSEAFMWWHRPSVCLFVCLSHIPANSSTFCRIFPLFVVTFLSEITIFRFLTLSLTLHFTYLVC